MEVSTIKNALDTNTGEILLQNQHNAFRAKKFLSIILREYDRIIDNSWHVVFAEKDIIDDIFWTIDDAIRCGFYENVKDILKINTIEEMREYICRQLKKRHICHSI